jgi:hypothetical protein
MAKKASHEVTVTSAPGDPQERRTSYNRAVREARLVTILLSKVDFNVNREIPRPSRDNSDRPNLSFGGTMSNFFFDEEKKVCIARVEWKVELKSGRQKFAKCTATYDVMYDGFGDVDEAIIRLFAENVAQPATYSYFRSLFASLDWSADLRLPPLPIVKFHPKV